MTNRFNNGQFDDDGGTDPIASLLSQAMSSRDRQMRSSPGSLQDVRMRARRITRRRSAVGAGALAAVGAVGAVAVATRGNDGNGPRIVAGEGGTPDGDARFAIDGGYWRCTGPLADVVTDYNETLVLSGIVASTVPAGYQFPETTVPELAATTTMPDGFIGSTAVSNTVPDPTATSVEYGRYSTTSTIDPSVKTSTTIDASATTSTLPIMGSTTIDPGYDSATTLLPSPYPMSQDGVYFMRDCTFVAGTSDTSADVGGTVAPATTLPAGDESMDSVPAISDPPVETLSDVIDGAPPTFSEDTTVTPTTTSTTIAAPGSTTG